MLKLLDGNEHPSDLYLVVLLELEASVLFIVVTEHLPADQVQFTVKYLEL